MDDVDVPVESDGPDRVKRARQVLDGDYEQARACDYERDTPAMRILGLAEQNYQQVRQDGPYDGRPVEPGERDPLAPGTRPRRRQ